MLPLLITEANRLGYEVSMGECWRPGDRRCHGMRIAVDLNLWENDKVILTDTGHRELGPYWERLGGSWGGRFKSKDFNHYSLAHNGKR